MTRLKPDYKPAPGHGLEPGARRPAMRGKVRHHHYVLGAALAGILTVMLANVASQPIDRDNLSAFDSSDRRTLDLPSRSGSVFAGLAENQSGQGITLRVQPGNTLAGLFDSARLSRTDLHAIVQSSEEAENLRRIRPGDTIHVKSDENGNILALDMEVNPEQRLEVRRLVGGFATEIIDIPVQRVIKTASGTIESSLYAAGYAAGLSDSLIMNLANIFGWDIDFALDMRAGDEFRLIYEEIHRDGEKIRDGDIIAAEFFNDGRRLQAIRFTDQQGRTAYYSPDGRAMRKTFLRAPLNFSYVSSNFNPKRFHPILKRVKAHNGIDYRAPQGTPVYAAGDGRVIRSSYDKYNGHHVFIQHGENYVTKYLHFTRRAVKIGDRVRQGQTIGYVGMTGLAEAPHLHYEFLVNGTHRNPRTVRLPDAEPIADNYLAEFVAVSKPLMRELELIRADDSSRLVATPTVAP